jgi:glyoxylase-like metal-dependent hydrolase (beta-lactamase superfamily II)
VKVVAARYATLETTRSDCFLRYHSYGEPDGPQRMDYFFWLLRDGGETIVVDTGFDPGVGARRGRTCLVRPRDALARLGVDPGSVSRLVLTHLHYDHTGNLDAFPEAELYVQERELEFWRSPAATRFQFAATVESDELAAVYAAQSEGRVRVLSGDEELAPGVRLVLVGGHSPGQQILAVDGASGPIVLASDALHFYEELERDRPFSVLSDVAEMYLGYDTLRELSGVPGGQLVAGHDPSVLDRFRPVDGDAAGFAVEIA